MGEPTGSLCGLVHLYSNFSLPNNKAKESARKYYRNRAIQKRSAKVAVRSRVPL
jgi:hypothetical protein